jgi:GNAT superfamily N-acetyltransferase
MTTGQPGLEEQFNVAQSILSTPAAAEAARLEWALATACRAVAITMAQREPDSGAGAHVGPAGMAIFAGAGSPLTQGMAMGLRGPVTAAELDAVEAHLQSQGSRGCQLEVCTFADPTLFALLAERGYRIKEWQLVWARSVPEEPLAPPPPELSIRPVERGQEELFCRVDLAGALETEDVPSSAIDLLLPFTFAQDYELYLAWLDDEPIGAAVMSFADGVAFVNGSAVRPAFRRRGAQGALIRARLDRARMLGIKLACSNTQPGTASRRNMERHGFSVAYPKVVMVRGD